MTVFALLYYLEGYLSVRIHFFEQTGKKELALELSKIRDEIENLKILNKPTVQSTKEQT